jgi:hypothetical protein
LVWDESEDAYYRFFLSCDGKTKENLWMSEPSSDLARISFRRKEKKRKEKMETKREEEECADNQQNAQNEGFCCHHHAKRMKLKDEEERKMTKQMKVDGPDHCIHCDEDPCVFLQIESRWCENDTMHYDEDEYANNPVAYNSGRRKQAYQYAAFVLWEGINYRRPHYTCVENGVRALFPPLDGKIMGYKND